ncbi:MAG: hypothetical protein Q9174_004913, partial [Haloplaca sp. 1 TL-2023]
ITDRKKHGRSRSKGKRKWWNYPRRSSSIGEEDEKIKVPELTTIETKSTEESSHPSPRPGDEVLLNTRDLYTPAKSRSILDKLTKTMIETARFQSHAPTSNLVDYTNVKIHGVCQLAPGYALSYIPQDVKVYSHIKQTRTVSISRLLGVSHTPDIKLASTHDVPRILFSIIQTISGAYSLYRARGTQIQRYGYAAYGLTPLPYMMVSVINLIGSLLTSEYETVYLVHSAIMDEMKSRGGLCDGAVGTLERPESQLYVYLDNETDTKPEGRKMQFHSVPGELRCHDVAGLPKTELQISNRVERPPPKDLWFSDTCTRWWRGEQNKKSAHPEPKPDSTLVLSIPSHSAFTRLSPVQHQPLLNILTITLLILALALPYIIIAILTGWRLGNSTSTQRTFVLNWLICGQVQGYAVSYIERQDGRGRVLKAFLIMAASYGSYCAMGLFVVAQEMVQSGTCKAL